MESGFLSFAELKCLSRNWVSPDLDMAVGVYPLLLMIPTYFLIGLYDRNFRPTIVLWKPFKAILKLFRRGIEERTSLIDAFSTFFLLSNIKLLLSSFDLLVPVMVYQLNTTGHTTKSLRTVQ